MKKIVSTIMISTFALTSCFGWWTKYENLPVEKQEEISKKVDEKRNELIEKIDTTNLTDEANLTPENIQKNVTEKIQEIDKKVVEEIKKEEGIDTTLIENRLNNTEKTSN